MSMHTAIRVGRPALAAMLLAMLVSGCHSYISHNVSDQGRATEYMWPTVESAVTKGGTIPNLDNLRRIQPGVSKEQLRSLVGIPHFNTGFYAREWDYLFQLRGSDGKEVACQYKVIFDKDMRGQDFRWLPASCGALVGASSGAG